MVAASGAHKARHDKAKPPPETQRDQRSIIPEDNTSLVTVANGRGSTGIYNSLADFTWNVINPEGERFHLPGEKIPFARQAWGCSFASEGEALNYWAHTKGWDPLGLEVHYETSFPFPSIEANPGHPHRQRERP